MNDDKSGSTTVPTPPVAGERAHRYTRHGVTIDDPWHWLRDAAYPNVEDPDVLAYLEAENDYFEARMSPHRELTDTIFEEIKGRQQPDLSSVPWKRDGWYYQWRYEEEGQYRVWQRWPADGPDAREGPTADAQTILDEPALAKDLEYFSLGSVSVSNEGSLLAYSADTNGSERFRMVVKDLRTGNLLEEEIEDTIGGAVWAADDASFFYTVVDENWRPREVRHHVLGEPVGQDAVVYVEDDPGFFVRVYVTASREYVVVGAGDIVTTEIRLIPASDPGAEPLLVAPRRAGHEYDVDHQGDRFVIRTNDRHKNSRLATAPADDPTEKAWAPLVEPSDSHHIRGFESFMDFIAVEERIEGLDQVRLIDRMGESTYVPFPEATYTVHTGDNEEFQTDTVRLEYTSLVTPSTVFDYHVDTGELEVRKVQEIPSGYDSSGYVTERVVGHGPGRGAGPGVDRAPQGHARGRQRTALRLCLWVVRACRAALVLGLAAVAAGPRLHLRHRARSRGRRPGLSLVRGGQAGQAQEHFQRLRGRRPPPGRTGVRERGADSDLRGQRRGAGDGRGGEPGAGALGRGGFPRPVRGRAEYDTGRHAAPHAHRVAGVGRPNRGRGRVRVHPLLLALRPARVRATTLRCS